MGLIHPTKKGTPENYSILLGFLFILFIIIASFAFFNRWGYLQKNILHNFVYFFRVSSYYKADVKRKKCRWQHKPPPTPL